MSNCKYAVQFLLEMILAYSLYAAHSKLIAFFYFFYRCYNGNTTLFKGISRSEKL
jgi:hypothetical protein